MLGLDKLFDYYCSANKVTPEQMNKMIIGLLAVIVVIQILSFFINILVQFTLKNKDRQLSFKTETYSLRRVVYEKLFNDCKNIYRNILTSSGNHAIQQLLSDVTMFLGNNEIHISKKMQEVSQDLIDSIHEFNIIRSSNKNKNVSRAFEKFKKEYGNYDNY